MNTVPIPNVTQPQRAIPLLSIAVLLLTGCVSTNRTALAPAAQSQLKSVAVTVTVNQPEIAAEVLRSNVGQSAGAQGGFIGGLIGGIIDASIESKRAKKAETGITPVRDALVDFNAPEELRVEVAGDFQNDKPSLPVASVSLAEAKDEAAIRKLVAASKSDAVLIVAIDYHLSPGFETMRVLAKVSLFSTKAARETDHSPLYQNEFATYRNLPAGLASNPENCAAGWAANKGALAREAMKSSFAELAAMIKFDLSQGTEANLLPKTSLTTIAPPANRRIAEMGPGLIFKGAIAQEHGNRKWVRLQTGELSSTE